MKSKLYIKFGLLFLVITMLQSCEDFLELEVPAHKIVSASVFSEDATALSAMKGIYNQLFQAAFSSGDENSVTVLAGLSSDNLKSIRENDLSLREFSQHEINPDNERNLDLWSDAYNIIYMTNSLLEGVGASHGLSVEVSKRLEGEAKFIRAFTYFYLVNLYGEIPLIVTTDYRENALASQNSKEEVYDQVLEDLLSAEDLLGEEYLENDRTRVNRYAAKALLARVNLFLGNWAEAEQYSSEVIANTGQYEILDDLNQVFLKNSKEAIWQISPEGRGGPLGYTNEGITFLFLSFAPSITKVALEDGLVETFDSEDLRRQNWIGFNDATSNYFPFKYKDRKSFGEILEYSMVLRLAEQYLIRAETRAQMGNSDGAIEDLNVLRKRAGISILDVSDTNLNQGGLLNFILQERRKELFAEWGHRWLDLKRLNIASDILNIANSNWDKTDVLYPIPSQERMKDPNLKQNQGY